MTLLASARKPTIADPRQDYTPSDFAREGFIHCTDSLKKWRMLPMLYKSNLDPHYYSYIDKTRPRIVRYDDAGHNTTHLWRTQPRYCCCPHARRDKGIF
jgi:hypothetical protein